MRTMELDWARTLDLIMNWNNLTEWTLKIQCRAMDLTVVQLT